MNFDLNGELKPFIIKPSIVNNNKITEKKNGKLQMALRSDCTGTAPEIIAILTNKHFLTNGIFWHKMPIFGEDMPPVRHLLKKLSCPK